MLRSLATIAIIVSTIVYYPLYTHSCQLLKLNAANWLFNKLHNGWLISYIKFLVPGMQYFKFSIFPIRRPKKNELKTIYDEEMS